MHEAVEPLIEMYEWVWRRFKEDLKDLTPDEIEWRPLPQANNINLIIRHLRMETEWQLAGLERGEAIPADVTPEEQQVIDSVSFDFEENLKALDASCTRFIAVLREMNSEQLKQRTEAASRNYPRMELQYLLSYHHAIHLSVHYGQIRTIRNLYCKTRGQPARFFPVNPTFPR